MGKEKLLSFDAYPDVGIAAAREKRTAAKALLVARKDPMQNKFEMSPEEAETFRSVAKRWHDDRTQPFPGTYVMLTSADPGLFLWRRPAEQKGRCPRRKYHREERREDEYRRLQRSRSFEYEPEDVSSGQKREADGGDQQKDAHRILLSIIGPPAAARAWSSS